MNVLDEVLALARDGVTPPRTAERLGVPLGLVEAALDHWKRTGAVRSATDACQTCGTVVTPACATCPIVSLRAR
ncbi:hypothetical protein IGS67_09635 [Flavimobilis sp. GY10621]|uniref:FeoC like transcriptional regulator n=1 Tax=Flavimobilis rhizosphaerae TaxID=2775421 RepID=A0ABR9DS61_9MICO|nr:hypothetical protein [Flavimobilis rhizosphaerae]MBD9699749.1 hypothetical protein [Flavimobilis rhizosphaerae]